MDALPPQGAGVRLSQRRFHAAMGVLLLVEVLSSLETSMVVGAFPTIMREFNGISSVGWLLTGFLLAQAATAAIGGRLGDMFGRRRMLVILVALCIVGSLISAVASSLELIILGRVIQGASGAVLPLCYGIAREYSPPGRAAFWIGVLSGGFACAAAVGYILSGVLVDFGSWRNVFWCTAGYGAVLLPLLVILVPETTKTGIGQKLDVMGAVLFAPAIAAVLYGITEAGKAGLASLHSWPFILGGLVTLAIWVRHEGRQADPLIDIRLFRRREIVLGNVCTALTSFGISQVALVGMMLLQQPAAMGIGLGIGATVAALFKLPGNVIALVAAPVSGSLSGRYGGRWGVFAGAVIGASGWAFLYVLHDVVWQVVAGTLIISAGAAMLLAALPILVLEGTPPERSSETTGLTQMVRATFSAVGAQAATIFLATSLVTDPGTGAQMPSEAAYQLTFMAFGIAAAAIAVIVTLTPRLAGAKSLAA